MSAFESLSVWLRGVRRSRGALVVAALGLASTAFAGKDTLLSVSVQPLDTQVSVSSPTNLGYTIDIANDKPTGTATNVRFTAKLPSGATALLVVSGSPGVPAPSCPVSGDVLTCSFGNLSAGQVVPTFRIFFEVPSTAGTVKFVTTTYYAEGEGPNAIRNNSSIVRDPEVVVGPLDPDDASTVVPPRAGGNVTFRTDGTDKFSTVVNVPTSSAAYALGVITETPNTVVCNNFIECFDSTLDVKRADGAAFEPYLSIALTVLAENVKPGTQLGSLVLYYKADSAVGFEPVNPCLVANTAEAKPCLNGPVVVTKVPGKGNNLTFNVISLFNGTYRLP
jgi:hypothetical protein